MIRTVYERQAGRDKATIDLRTRQVIEAPRKCQGHMEKWLAQGLEQSDTFLDLGCGAGMLAAAAAPYANKTIGIDVSMEWLVVAERLIREYGGQPILAAAMAEYMPLPPGAVDFVVSLDVIEHVSNQSRYLSEIDRILKPGGHIALSTPNRFSLTAEPHVFVWGVGWFPRRWQKWYVNAIIGKSYENTCLMSYWGLENLIRKNTDLSILITPGTVSHIDMSKFPPLRRQLARIYNRVHRMPVLRWLFRIICPFFRLQARSNDTVTIECINYGMRIK